MDRTDSGLVIFILLLIIGLMVVVNTPGAPGVQNSGVMVVVDSQIHAPVSTLRCQQWHSVRRGETQWRLARHYAGRSDIRQWIKTMRLASQKHVGDDGLNVGERVCVRWRRG